jgi:hypothetical protein
MIAPGILVLLRGLSYGTKEAEGDEMHFKTMDPELAWKAIEGYEDVLSAERRTLDAFYRQFKCKRCGSNCRKEMVKGHVFGEELVPRSCLRCLACQCLFDPHTGLILEVGEPADGVPILKPGG